MCLDCGHKKECEDPESEDPGYLAELAAAGSAAHAVMTNGRAHLHQRRRIARGGTRCLHRGPDGSTSSGTVRVKADGGRAAFALAAIIEAARRCYDESGFFQAVGDTARVLLMTAGRGERGTVDVPAAGDPPRGWARRFRRAGRGARRRN